MVPGCVHGCGQHHAFYGAVYSADGAVASLGLPNLAQLCQIDGAVMVLLAKGSKHGAHGAVPIRHSTAPCLHGPLKKNRTQRLMAGT